MKCKFELVWLVMKVLTIRFCLMFWKLIIYCRHRMKLNVYCRIHLFLMPFVFEVIFFVFLEWKIIFKEFEYHINFLPNNLKSTLVCTHLSISSPLIGDLIKKIIISKQKKNYFIYTLMLSSLPQVTFTHFIDLVIIPPTRNDIFSNHSRKPLPEFLDTHRKT